MATPVDPLAQLRAALPAAYTLDGHLSSGGQGSVFRGRVSGTLAAVKVYSATSDPRRIERELRIDSVFDAFFLFIDPLIEFFLFKSILDSDFCFFK